MSNSVLPDDILRALTPSATDGVSNLDEKMNRKYGCELIQDAAIRMKFKQVVAITGQSLLHRFYYRKSIKTFDPFSVAMACLLLSSKVEEQPRLLKDYVITFHSIYETRKKLVASELDTNSPRYYAWNDELVMAERYILKELGFSFYRLTDHPHKYLLYMVKLVDGDSQLAQISWNYLNDSCRLDLSLRYEPHLIACAALQMAIIKCNFQVKDASCWETIATDPTVIDQIIREIASLYEMPTVAWMQPISIPPYMSREVCIDDVVIEEPNKLSLEIAPSRGFTSGPVHKTADELPSKSSWRDRVTEDRSSSNTNHKDFDSHRNDVDEHRSIAVEAKQPHRRERSRSSGRRDRRRSRSRSPVRSRGEYDGRHRQRNRSRSRSRDRHASDYHNQSRSKR